MLDLNDSLQTLLDAGHDLAKAECEAEKAKDRAANYETLEEIDGRVFIRRDGRLHAPDRYPGMTSLSGLDSLLAYRRYVGANFGAPDMLLGISDNGVSLFCRERYGHTVSEPFFALAAPPAPARRLDEFMSIEKFVLMLKTAFVNDESLAALLAIVGNIKFEEGLAVADDGVSQQVSTKAGVHFVERAKIPADLTLTCYESFPEVQADVPPRPYFLRLKVDDSKTPQAALFGVADPTADLHIRRLIRDYLVKRLIEDDQLPERQAADLVLV